MAAAHALGLAADSGAGAGGGQAGANAGVTGADQGDGHAAAGWQISGRNRTYFDARTEFDVEYVMTLVHLDGRVDPRPHFLGRAPPGWSHLDSSNLKIESPFSGEKKN